MFTGVKACQKRYWVAWAMASITTVKRMSLRSGKKMGGIIVGFDKAPLGDS